MTDKNDFYSAHQVESFTKPMFKWLIPHLPMLRSGDYPRDPKESGYTDSGIKSRQFKAGAAFETPAGIAAEMDSRIQKCGFDGLLMEFLYAFEPDDELFVIEHMAQCLNLGRKEVSQRIRNALYFVSGRDRKAVSYTKYIRDNPRYLRQK